MLDSFVSCPFRIKARKASCDEIVPLKVEQGSPTSDAAQLVSNDSKRAQITPIPFSVETTGAQDLDSKLPADLSGLPANLNDKHISLHELLPASCPADDGDDNVALVHDDAPSHDKAPPRDENEDNLLEDKHDDDDLFGECSLILPDAKFRSKFSNASPLDTGSPRNRKRSRDNDDALFLNFLLTFSLLVLLTILPLLTISHLRLWCPMKTHVILRNS